MVNSVILGLSCKTNKIIIIFAYFDLIFFFHERDCGL